MQKWHIRAYLDFNNNEERPWEPCELIRFTVTNDDWAPRSKKCIQRMDLNLSQPINQSSNPEPWSHPRNARVQVLGDR